MNGLGGSGHALAFPSANSIMQPRIYTYKITFEEIPHWYWGVHKEKKYNDGYLGSPVTHKWMWEFYTPHICIIEVFPCTAEGWREASEVEKRLIKHDLNNPLCLNESCGVVLSVESLKKGGKAAATVIHAERDELGRSIQGLKNTANLAHVHNERDELGRSIQGLKYAKNLANVHNERDEQGRSVLGVRNGQLLHRERDERGKSLNAVRGGRIGGKRVAPALNAQMWMSTEDGFISNLGNVAKHNKSIGADPKARIRIK